MSAHAILLVEDNPNDVALTLRALTHASVAANTTVIGDGSEALDYLLARGAYATRDASDVPQVVLLDLNLPRVSGLEILRAVRADPRTRLVRVVVLTSSKDEKDLLASYETGANGYIVKPVDLDQFFDAVRSLGLYWLRLNEPPPVQLE